MRAGNYPLCANSSPHQKTTKPGSKQSAKMNELLSLLAKRMSPEQIARVEHEADALENKNHWEQRQ